MFLSAKNKISLKAVFFCLFVVCVFTLPRIYGLGRDIVNKDAYHFKNWSYVYMKEFESRNFEKLYVTVQPGVLTIYSNIIGLKAAHFFSDKTSLFEFQDKEFELFTHTLQKIPKVFFITLSGIVSILVVNAVFGFNTTFYFALLFSLEPYLLGQTRVIQTDALPTYLVFLATLCLVYWEQKKKEIATKHKTLLVVLIGILLALSTIEKASSLIFVPLFMLYMSDFKIKKNNYPVGIFITVFITTLFVLFPVFWVDPLFTSYRLTIGSYIQGVVGLDAENFTFEKAPHIKPWFYYFRFLYNTLSEFTLIGLLLFAIKAFKEKHKLNLTSPLLVIPFAYLFVHQIANKKGGRLITMLFPFILLAAAIGFEKVLTSYKARVLFSVVFLTWMGFGLVNIFPDFLLYKNKLSFDLNYNNSAEAWGSGRYKLGKYIENSYGTKKNVYIGDHTTFDLFYDGKVKNADEFACTKRESILVTLNKTQEKCENLVLDSILQVSDLNFYVYLTK